MCIRDSKEDRDDNNRLLRYVYLENNSSTIQEYLLKEGYAKEYTHKGIFYENQALHKTLEQEAKTNQKGLWSSNCNKE